MLKKFKNFAFLFIFNDDKSFKTTKLEEHGMFAGKALRTFQCRKQMI